MCLTSCVLVRSGKVKQEPTLYREGPPYQRRGSLQLWQFLVTLLDDPANAHFIAWTGRGMEFKLIEPEEVWGWGGPDPAPGMPEPGVQPRNGCRVTLGMWRGLDTSRAQGSSLLTGRETRANGQLPVCVKQP